MNDTVKEFEELIVRMTQRAMPGLVRDHEIAWAYNPSQWMEYKNTVREAGEHARQRGLVVRIPDGWAARL